jgi:peroxiredoxin
VSRETKIITPGDEPKIHDFNLVAEDGNDYTEDILEEEYVLLAIMYDVEKADKAVAQKLATLAEDAYKNDIYFYGVSASPAEKVEKFRHDNQLAFDFLSADGIVLKTMIRSNPGIILLNTGTVIGKWPASSIPEYSEIKRLISQN